MMGTKVSSIGTLGNDDSINRDQNTEETQI